MMHWVGASSSRRASNAGERVVDSIVIDLQILRLGRHFDWGRDAKTHVSPTRCAPYPWAKVNKEMFMRLGKSAEDGRLQSLQCTIFN